jgi:hypothetical protein
VTVIVLCNLGSFALADELSRGVGERLVPGLREAASQCDLSRRLGAPVSSYCVGVSDRVAERSSQICQQAPGERLPRRFE